ncbi:hypothetical protein BHE74_00008153 [Ensete ventricosum]|nr:hypothetical protein BHE74_00008153 [Ensete ventricosum]
MSVQLHGTASKELLSSLGLSMAILRPANSAGTRIEGGEGGGRGGGSRQVGEAAEKEEETRLMMKRRIVQRKEVEREGRKEEAQVVVSVLRLEVISFK